MTIYSEPKPVTGKFGPTVKNADGTAAAYPEEMRRQLWPLCCGAGILSGFKNVGNMTTTEMVKAINETIDEKIPDLQVYASEQMRPKLTWLTLNSGQTESAKIMAAITAAGFVKVATARPRGGVQTFFVRDTSNTFESCTVKKGVAA